MARVKVMSAMAFDVETYEADGVPDPALKILGETPGVTRPFNIHRVYKGAQGRYEESVLLVDPDGIVIWESQPRFIELRGEMFEDLFRTQVTDDIPIESVREHTIVFLLDGQQVGRIPVFIDAPESLLAAGALGDATEAALKKGAVVWLSIPQRDGSAVSRPAWYVQQGRKLFFLKGPDEQELPNLEHCDIVRLTVKSKEIKATIGEFDATVRVVENDSEEFDRIAGLGLGIRLNLTDGDAALDRWKATCTMVELTPQN